MTDQEFEKIVAGVRQAASEEGVDLDNAAYPYTVWLEKIIGSGIYFNHAKCRDMEDAKRQAGNLQAVIYGVQVGKIQVVIWREYQWVDAYTYPP